MAIDVLADLALPRDPTSDMHAATKQYVDQLFQGFAPKDNVRVAATGNITIATALNNGDVIDGVTLATGDRVLVPLQTAPAENGIYVVAASPGRAPDADSWGDIVGMRVIVEEGTTYHDTLWLATADAGGTLNTTAINFTQMPTLSDLIAGGGVGKTGNTIFVTAGTGLSQDADGLSIDTAVVPRKAAANTFTKANASDLSAEAQGTIPWTLTGGGGSAMTGGAWIEFFEGASSRGVIHETADKLGIRGANGLTLGTSAGDLSLFPSSGMINVGSSRLMNVADPTAAGDGVPRSWAVRAIPGTITGDGAANPLPFTHNLNTTDVWAFVQNNTTKKWEMVEWTPATVNRVDITFPVPLANLVVKRVIVMGIQG